MSVDESLARQFVEDLSEEKFLAVQKAVRIRANREAEERAKEFSLEIPEKQLVKRGYPIHAMKLFRDRTGEPLRVCRAVVKKYKSYVF